LWAALTREGRHAPSTLPFLLAGNVGYYVDGGSGIRVIRIITNIRDWAANRPFKPAWMISPGENQGGSRIKQA